MRNEEPAAVRAMHPCLPLATESADMPAVFAMVAAILLAVLCSFADALALRPDLRLVPQTDAAWPFNNFPTGRANNWRETARLEPGNNKYWTQPSWIPVFHYPGNEHYKETNDVCCHDDAIRLNVSAGCYTPCQCDVWKVSWGGVGAVIGAVTTRAMPKKQAEPGEKREDGL